MAHFFDFADAVALRMHTFKDDMVYASKFTGVFDYRSIVITEKDLNDLEGLKEQLKLKELDLGSVYFDLQDFYGNLQKLQEALNVIKQHSEANEITKFMVVNNRYHHYSPYQLAGLTEFEKQIQKTFSLPEDYESQDEEFMAKLSFPSISTYNSNPIHIDQTSRYTLEQVKHSSMIINSVITDIKNANLSPYEAFLAAYTWVTSFEYNTTGTLRKLNSKGEVIERVHDYSNMNFVGIEGVKPKERDYRLSRYLTDVFSTGFMVCVAYADMLDLMCKELGIKSFHESYKVNKENYVDGKVVRTSNGHRRTIVMIDDEKYGLKNGVFNADVTKGYKRYGQGEFTDYVNHLLPLKETYYDETSPIANLANGEQFESEDETFADFATLLVERGFVDAKMPAIRANDFAILRGIKNTGFHPLKSLYSKYAVNKHELGENDLPEVEKQSLEIAKGYIKYVDLYVDERDRVFNEFYERAQNTEPVSQQNFYKALKNIVPLIKPGVEPEDFANWIMNENIEWAKVKDLPTPTFADLKVFEVKGNYIGGHDVDVNSDEAKKNNEMIGERQM